MGREFMLKINDGAGWSENYSRYPGLLRPASMISSPVPGWGSHRILVNREEISFSDEDFGFHVVFETGSLSHEEAEKICNEICENIKRLTGCKTEIIPL